MFSLPTFDVLMRVSLLRLTDGLAWQVAVLRSMPVLLPEQDGPGKSSGSIMCCEFTKKLTHFVGSF
jgi:hypothetical protein